MSEGNGVDLGSIYGLLLQLQQQMQDARAELKGDIAGLRNEMQQEFAAVRSEARRDNAELRQTIAFYHSSVLGHGVLITELDDRLRRVEQHLGLPSLAAS